MSNRSGYELKELNQQIRKQEPPKVKNIAQMNLTISLYTTQYYARKQTRRSNQDFRKKAKRK